MRRMFLKSKGSTSHRRISQLFLLAVFSLCLLFASSCKREAPAPSADNAAMRQQRGAEVVAEYLKRDASPYRKNRVRMTIVAAV